MTTAERARRAREREDGFTIIEVMVALIVFALIAGAAAAMLVGGTKAAVVTRMDTGAKELGQQQLEAMRNLLHQPDGGSDSSAVELLKKYFPAYSSTSVGCGVTGYVAAGVTRCTSDGDPTSGAFYRTVIDPVTGFSKYKQYVTVDFMDKDRNPVKVDSTYSPSAPPSIFMGIGIQTIWQVGTMSKSFYLSAFIPSTSPASPETTYAAHATALMLQGMLDASRTATAAAGVLDLSGSLTLGATASSSAQGGYAFIDGGSRVDGSVKVSSVPPSDSGAPYSHTDSSPAILLDGTNQIAYINSPSYSGVGAWTTNGLPTSGSSGTPVTGYVPKQGSGQRDVSFNNDASPDALLQISSGPLVWVTQGATGDPVPAADSTANSVRATGYATTTATSGATRHAVSTTVTARTQTIHLLPTSFAPNGLVQIRLVSSSLTCKTDGQTAPQPGVTYTAYVSFWEDKTATNWEYDNGSWTLEAPATSAGYTSYLTLSNAQSTDPLRTAPLSQILVGSNVGVQLSLSQYIASWQSLTSAESAAVGQVDTSTKAVTGSVASVLSLTTAPMRTADATSGVGVTLANLTCSAMDVRP